VSTTKSAPSRWRAVFRFDGSFWRRFAYLGCVYGPEWWKTYSPGPIAAILFLIVGGNRRGAMENLRVVLGCSRWQAATAALRMFAEFARCFTETTEYYSPRRKPIRFDVSEDDTLAAALQSGRGAVIVTGHLGNWDIAAKGLRDYGAPVNLVMAREANATMQQRARDAKEEAGIRVIYSDVSVFSSFNMIRALRNNEIVAIQLDRPVGAGGMRRVEFFGRAALFPSGPFLLARLAGAPVIPVFAPRIGRRHYAIRLGACHEVPRDREGGALDRVMREVIREFEAAVGAYPLQWFQFTPFWSKESAAGGTVDQSNDEQAAHQVQAGGR
jgi:KDO2-lipid IV(A) lauroyltransferase